MGCRGQEYLGRHASGERWQVVSRAVARGGGHGGESWLRRTQAGPGGCWGGGRGT